MFIYLFICLLYLSCFYLELSYQDGSIYNSELNLTNPDAECQTDPLEEMGENGGEEQAMMNSMDEKDLLHKPCENMKRGQIEVRKKREKGCSQLL